MPDFTIIISIILGGAVPSLVWLYFLLKEDSRFPEPRIIVALAFFAGMIATVLVIPLEQYVSAHGIDGLRLTIAIGTIEETMKYLLAALIILWLPVVDEPLDYVIYLITVALGFAALENAIYFIHMISLNNVTIAAINDARRMISATLLHVLATSVIGFALAFSYKMQPRVRMLWASGGIILAIALHTMFDELIMGKGIEAVRAVLFVWVGIIVMLFLFEVLKRRENKSLRINTH